MKTTSKTAKRLPASVTRDPRWNQLRIEPVPLEDRELIAALVDVVVLLDRNEMFSYAEAVRILCKKAGIEHEHPELVNPAKVVKTPDDVWAALDRVNALHALKGGKQ